MGWKHKPRRAGNAILATTRREWAMTRGGSGIFTTYRGKTYNAAGEEVDPFRECEHEPDQVYTRQPCSCGRPLWPPRERGRGESLSSPRRIAAKLRACEVTRLHIQGHSYETIAALLGYKTASGAWRAEQRLRDHDAAWLNYYDRRGKHDWYQRHLLEMRLRDAHARGGDAEVDRELKRMEYMR